jgi:hypothetical protein
MGGPAPGTASAPEAARIASGSLAPDRIVRRIPGRNRTKAEILVYRASSGEIALKHYASRPWVVRNTLGRWFVGRECRAYEAAGPAPGLPRFRGRRGPFALAVDWIHASPLADRKPGTVEPECFDRLSEIVCGLHARGVALADLNYRDVLLAPDGSVYVIDLAAACVLGPRPGRLRRRAFDRFRAADRFAIARLRVRFAGGSNADAVAAADPRIVAWHRRARRVKYCWDKLRGARRLPPVDDHWRF